VPDVKKLTTSLEDYLEAILILVRRGYVARVRDIAGRLGVGMPSVTAALKTLAKRKLVNYDPYQVITLTEQGRRIGEEIGRRHELLRRFLTDVLGLRPQQAESNACRMEHAVDAAVVARLGKLVQFVRSRGGGVDDWTQAFRRFCSAPAARAPAGRDGSPPADQAATHTEDAS